MVDQLRASGLSVGTVSGNRTIVEATGPVSAVEAAFGVTISDWHDRDQNRDFFGNDTEPTLPAAVASYVVGVAGLNNHYPLHRLGPAPKVGGGPAGGYTPNELKKAYDVTPLASAGYNGSGQPLGLFELDGFRQTNITTYDNQYGLGSPAPSKVLINGGPGSLGSGEVEVELDIEVMHAIAPASAITVWEGPNTDPGVNATYNAMVTSNTTKSNSTSWGICEPQTTQAEMTTLDNIFKQGAAQGQSFFAASGDYGAYDCGDSRLTVDSPANDPYITGTGGTALTLNSDGTYQSESAWSNLNTFPPTGGGGGLSSYFARPSWQTGPGVANTNSNGKRQVPDISSDADPNTGYSVYVTNGGTGWTMVGGTSAAAPSWAAFTSVYNQYAGANGKPNLGFPNPTLYSTASGAQPYTPFNDVTTGDNLHYPATTNWDYATGWGSYDAYNLARDLACCPSLAYTQAPQGNWVGNYGADGYNLLAWNGDDSAWFPQSAFVLDQGTRFNSWSGSAGTTDVRALQSPDNSIRRATCIYDPNQLRLHLTFSASYNGMLRLYALDWDSTGRREAITVNDGSGPRTANITSPFDQGAWVNAPINVFAGGMVTVTVDRKAGYNAVLSGLFLGGAPSLVYSQAPQGNWVGTYGADGYNLLAWNGDDSAWFPQSTFVLDQGSRFNSWSGSAGTSDVRALQSTDNSTRRATCIYDPNQVRIHITFGNPYTGAVHLYALDWDSTARREAITVNDGSGARTAKLTTAFDHGAWVNASISIPGGGALTITVDRLAGANAVLSGIILGGAPSLVYAQAPQGNWVGKYGSNGYDLLAWNGPSDLSALPQSSLTLDSGARYQWNTSTTNVRALQSPDFAGRKATTMYQSSQLRLHLTFASAYSGTIHIYAVDWDSSARRESITINDGNGPRTAFITASFNSGAWVNATISVAAGGQVTIMVDCSAGANAVLSGVFLD